jgi:hypothetical protein
MNYPPPGTEDGAKPSIDQGKMKRPSKLPVSCERIPALKRLTGIATRIAQDVVRS